MSADAASSELVWVISLYRSEVYHTDPDCQALRASTHSVRQVDRSVVSTYSECSFCSGFQRHTNAGIGKGCSCEAGVTGECEFCKAFDAIHDVPREARFCRIEDREVVAE